MKETPPMSTKMNWQQLLSIQRFRPKDGEIMPTSTPSTQEGADALRTDFHIDYDRVVFSGAFRRLGRKTQVHPFAEHDHTHNRLTHSVEVASVGRSLGNRVGVMMQTGEFLPLGSTPSDIGAVVQVACLAHDLGNPPFGHTGEEALRDWFRKPAHACYLAGLSEAERNDVQTYEGNAHSLRLLASLDNRATLTAFSGPQLHLLAEQDALVPAAKEMLVEALVDAVSSDQRVSVAEAELLRTVCAVLHCPLPALLERG